MTDTRIETPRSAEPRATKTTGLAMASAKSAATSTDEEVPAFSSLMAALDGFATGLPVASPTAEAQDEKTAVPASTEQDALLATQGHAPWMSLVGQTARLDAQGDADMRQGTATDFLSGRGSLTQLAHRQALQTDGANDAGAHAAFMTNNIQSDQLQAQTVQAQAASNFDAFGAAAVPVDAEGREPGQSAEAALLDEPATARAELAAPKMQTASHQGISLQGMTAVQPQTLEGLKDLLRAARAPSQEDGQAGDKAGPSNGAHDLLGAAAAVGAAIGSASAGMQGGGQNASDLGQGLGGQESAPAQSEQEVSEQVAFWVHQKTQNAALTIQHEGKPIQVQVQLNGQEAHVRFAADDEQARQLLADGQAQLRELLQAQGLNLAGVSVDAGGAGAQQSGGRSEDGQPAQARMTRVAAQATELALEAAPGRRMGSQSGHAGVDLFV